MGLICPNCHKDLIKTETGYSCQNHHQFDIAKSGYVNLYLNAGKGRHGDDKTMVHARTEFLNAGYYEPLVKKVSEIVRSFHPQSIVDAGCGEGYYTSYISIACPDAAMTGIDISKDALAHAAKLCKNGEFAVASTANMPIKDGDADVLLNIFSPVFEEEFLRVLKKKGKWIRVIPLQMHLHELRKLIYDQPYDNVVPSLDVKGFSIISQDELHYEITIDNQKDLQNLFKMTPYYYKTGREDQQKLEQVSSLSISISFGIVCYEKE